MGVQTEDIRAQVGRLIQSKTFETSEVHRRLLQYLAEKSISGDADRLKEYTIGLEAFGKPPSYDPKHDSIVRPQAGRLRQKLAAYYQTEAAGDAIRVSMPKGAFKLNFEPVEVADHAHGAPWNPRRMIVLLSAALAMATLWAVASTIGLLRLHRETRVIDRKSTRLNS